MIHKENLEKQPSLRGEQSYRVPGTTINIFEGEFSKKWVVEDESTRKYLVNDGSNCFHHTNYVTSNRIFFYQFPSLDAALNAYNKSITSVLPESTDIIDYHKVE